MVAASVSVPFGSHFSAALVGEAGYALFTVGGLVGGVREVAVAGPWIGVQLALGIIP